MCITIVVITSKLTLYYALVMTYAIGTYIDLSHLNAQPTKPRSFRETASNLFAPGTQFSFQQVGNKLIAARHIPVAFG